MKISFQANMPLQDRTRMPFQAKHALFGPRLPYQQNYMVFESSWFGLWKWCVSFLVLTFYLLSWDIWETLAWKFHANTSSFVNWNHQTTISIHSSLTWCFHTATQFVPIKRNGTESSWTGKDKKMMEGLLLQCQKPPSSLLFLCRNPQSKGSRPHSRHQKGRSHARERAGWSRTDWFRQQEVN